MSSPVDTEFESGKVITSAWLNGINDTVISDHAVINNMITSNTTINVPADYATLTAAFAYLNTKSILSNVTVTVQVADGTYTLTTSLSLNHPQASQIRLVGNELTPSNCILRVATSGFDCFVSSNGNTFGYLNGFKFYKTVKALASDNSTAILALNGATIICGTSIIVDNWYYGIAARNGSFIYAPSAQVDHSGDVGIWAFVGSSIEAPNAVSNNAIDVANNLGFGFQAEYGSALNCSGSSATGCQIAGIAALSGSTVRALATTSTSNIGSGFLVRDQGEIENHTATSTNNTRYGEEIITSGFISGSGKTISGNTLGSNNGVVYLDNGSLGARIAANGDLRIDNNSTGSTFFNTSGGSQLQIAHTAGSVNYPKLTGTSGTTVSFEPTGSGTNIDVSLKGKNNGFVFLGNSWGNYLRVNPAATGSSPQLRAEGVDTDLDLLLGGKGTGTVRFGTWTSNADAPITGYITIKDFTGNVRKIATIA